MIYDISKRTYFDRLNELSNQEIINLQKSNIKDKRIHVVYVVGNPSLCGATKIIYEHANRLIERGLHVTIISYGEEPNWISVMAKYIRVPSCSKLSIIIPNCDLIIATYYTHIGECVNMGIAPVIYFEQGDVHLFNFENLDKKHQEFIRIQLSLASYIMTVSKQAAYYINKIISSDIKVINNGIDLTVFKENKSKVNKNKDRYILMVGRDDLEFKGIKEIIKAYEKLKGLVDSIKLYWITPYISDKDILNKISKVFVNPPRETIVFLYQQAFLYISASEYESFSLPVVEAMACGCPVISADNAGVREYGMDNSNLLIYEKNNISDLINKILKILDDDKLSKVLVDNGINTAKKYSWDEIVDNLLLYYKEIAINKIKPNNKIEEWEILAKKEEISTEDYNKLIKILLFTKANYVYASRLYTINEDYKLARWELIAERKEMKNSEKKYILLKWGYGIFNIKSLKDKKYNIFTKHNNDNCINHLKELLINTREDKLHINKLIIFSYLLNSKINQANNYLANTLKSYELDSELYLLNLLIEINKGYSANWIRIYKLIMINGDVINQKEYIYNIIDVTIKIVRKLVVEVNSMEDILNFANELYINEIYEEAIFFYNKYLEDNVVNNEQILLAYRNRYRAYYFLEKPEEGRKACLDVFLNYIPMAEECYFLGLTYLLEERYKEAVFWFENIFTLEKPKEDLIEDIEAWTIKPYIQLTICYYYLEEIDKAIRYHELAKQIDSNNKYVKANDEFFKSLNKAI